MYVVVEERLIKKCNGNMLINLFFIQIIIVIITDISDWPKTVYKAVSYILTKGKIVKDDLNWHLVSCSFCQMWWIGLIYLLICHSFTIPYIALVALLSFLTPVSNNILLLMKDLIGFEINKIYEWLQKQTNMD